MAEAKNSPAAPETKKTATASTAVAKPAEAAKAPAAAKSATPKKAPAEKKPAAPKKAAAAKTAVPKKAAAKKASPAKKSGPGPEERYRMIEVAAYYVAERNGFIGDPREFWAEAEAQINRMLAND